MRLDLDEFAIEYDSAKVDEAELMAIIKKAGYTSKIATGEVSLKVERVNAGSSHDPILVDALARAKKENKPLVIDFYASWCAPCLRMIKTTFPDPQVASLLEQCIFLKVDTDKHPDLAQSFGVVGLPDIRFLAPDGSEIKRRLDYLDATAFATELREILGHPPEEK